MRVAPPLGDLLDRYLRVLFLEFTSPFRLLVIVVPLTTLAILLLVSPGRVYSGEMTWDLLFNLEGAWNLYEGQTAHVDFHHPLGTLTFALTYLGFFVTGVDARAFIFGAILFSVFILAASCYVTHRRLPSAAAAVAVIFLSLLVLLPVNLGDPPSAFTFAMSYNRLGWSAIVLLFMILFIPGRDKTGSVVDIVLGCILIVILFYLKITYFFAAIAGVGFALITSRHVYSARYGWLSALGVATAIACAPANFAYWQDIWSAVEAGAVRKDLLSYLPTLVANRGENTIFIIQLLCLGWLWRRGYASGSLLLIAIFLGMTGLAILSQNTQAGEVPLFVLVAFILYYTVAANYSYVKLTNLRGTTFILAAILTFPGVWSLTMLASVAGYYRRATDVNRTVVLENTDGLRDLAVPRDNSDLLEAFSTGRVAPDMLNILRSERPRYELTQSEYLGTLIEAVRMFGRGDGHIDLQRNPKVMVLDATNPLPFILGLTPPRGGNLWFEEATFPWPAAKQLFGDTDYVFIPKFAAAYKVKEEALTFYTHYLDENYRPYRNTKSWIVLVRSSAAEDRQ